MRTSKELKFCLFTTSKNNLSEIHIPRPTPYWGLLSVSSFSLGERIEIRLLTCNWVERNIGTRTIPWVQGQLRFHLTRIFTLRNSYSIFFFTSDSYDISIFFFHEGVCDYMFITYYVFFSFFFFFFLAVRANKGDVDQRPPLYILSKFIYLCSFLEVL